MKQEREFKTVLNTPDITAFAAVGRTIYGQHKESGDIYWWSWTQKKWVLYTDTDSNR